jgi:hypothetical protein
MVLTFTVPAALLAGGWQMITCFLYRPVVHFVQDNQSISAAFVSAVSQDRDCEMSHQANILKLLLERTGIEDVVVSSKSANQTPPLSSPSTPYRCLVVHMT